MLKVYRAKPNPIGKDTNHGHASASQLGGEWFDIKNVSLLSARLDDIVVNNLAYAQNGSSSWAYVTALSGTLGAQKVLRVHAGIARPLGVLHPTDLSGADFHVFTGSDHYHLNNDHGDKIGLWNTSSKVWVDAAAYAPHPQEGAVLVRQGDLLVHSSAGYARA